MKAQLLKYQIFSICLLSNVVSYGNNSHFDSVSSSLDIGVGYTVVPMSLNQFFTINRPFWLGSDLVSFLSTAGPYEFPQFIIFIISMLLCFSLIVLMVVGHSYRQKIRYINYLEAENIFIEEERETMEKHQRFKEKFITILAHDVINPFNSLIGFSTILREDFNVISEREKKEYIDVICRSAKSNYQTIKKLFKWVQKSQKTKLVSRQNMDLYTAIETVLQSHLSMFKSKNIAIENNIMESLELKADDNILSVIIANFINNAIKFTPNNGQIKIGCTVKEKVFQVFVEDNGLGMTKEQLNHLFDSEVQNKSTEGTHKETGFGLGLMLCKELAELHRGRIIIKSGYTKGTTAILELPL
jgi:signal transduction histidine kinase